jgi:CBS domain-containing protein
MARILGSRRDMTAFSAFPAGWIRVSAQPSPDGRHLRLTVDCPRDQRRQSLEICETCDAALELVPDEGGLGGHLRCAEASQRYEPPKVGTRLGATAPDPSTVAVEEVMQDVVFVAAPDLPLASLAAALLEHGISGAPVVDERGTLLGVASQTDLVRRWRRGTGYASAPPTGIVADVMTPAVVHVPPGTSLAHAAAVMSFERVHRLPIVREDGVIVGLLTPMDLARWMAEASGLVAPD